jgi:CHAT domain
LTVKLSDLRTGAVVHMMSDRSVAGVWLTGDATTEGFRSGPLGELVPLIDGLRDELRDTMAIARARVPRLEEFAAGWGRRLLPPAVLGGEVDVVVVVPHSLLHGLPLHVVIGDDGAPVGTRCGFTYASSMSLFVHCAERNLARAVDLEAWTFDVEGEAAACGYPLPSGATAGGTDVIHRGPGFVDLAREISELIDGERSPKVRELAQARALGERIRTGRF